MHVLLHSVSPTLQQATTDPHLCWRLLDTHRQVWVSLSWGHCSFLLGPGAQGSVCALQESISQSCVSSGSSMMGLMATSSKRAYAVPKSVAPALLTLTSTGDAQTQFCLGLCGVPGSWCRQGLFEPSDHLCRDIYSKCKLACPTILLGLLLCPWTWGILTATPAPTILLVFLRPWMWGISSRQSSKAQPRS